MALSDIIHDTVDNTIAVFNRIRHINPFRKLVKYWVTTSDEPCDFCNAMAEISTALNLGLTEPFPAPTFITGFRAPKGVPFTLSGPPAHKHCHCIIVTRTIVPDL